VLLTKVRCNWGKNGLTKAGMFQHSAQSAEDSNLDSRRTRRSLSGDTNERASKWYNKRFDGVFVCPLHEIADGISSLLTLVVLPVVSPAIMIGTAGEILFGRLKPGTVRPGAQPKALVRLLPQTSQNSQMPPRLRGQQLLDRPRAKLADESNWLTSKHCE